VSTRIAARRPLPTADLGPFASRGRAARSTLHELDAIVDASVIDPQLVLPGILLLARHGDRKDILVADGMRTTGEERYRQLELFDAFGEPSQHARDQG
jgi:hypothetical protein